MSTRPGARANAQVELQSMYDDHVEVGAALEKIHDLTDHFQAPGWACPTYRALLARLRSLQNDTHRHVHLENNVLLQRFSGQSVAKASAGQGNGEHGR
jgi:regulator of cell morphogenesis and NO signaling